MSLFPACNLPVPTLLSLEEGSMGIGSEALKLGAKAAACVVFPAAAPAIIFSEVAARAVRFAVQSDGGDAESAREAESTARGILGAGSLSERLFGGRD